MLGRILVSLSLWAALAGAQTTQSTSQPAATQAASQPSTEPATQQAPRDPAVVALVNTFDDEYDKAARLVHDRETALASAGPDPVILQQVPPLVVEIDASIDADGKRLKQPSLELLNNLQNEWAQRKAQLDDWQSQNRRELDQLTSFDSDLVKLVGDWTDHRNKLAANDDAELARRCDGIVAQASKLHARYGAPLQQVRQLQSQINAQLGRVQDFIRQLTDARSRAVSNLLERDSEPFWNIAAMQRRQQAIANENYISLRQQWNSLVTYVSSRPERLGVHAGLILAIALMARWIGRKGASWTEQDSGSIDSLAVLRRPISTGVAISLLASSWIYPLAPRLLWVILLWGSLLPIYLLLQKLMERRLRPLMRTLLLLWLVNTILGLLPTANILPRLLLIAQVGLGALLLTFVANSSLNARGEETPYIRRLRKALLTISRAAVMVLLLSMLANLCGYLGLARLLVNSLLTLSFIAIIILAGTRVATALLVGVLHLWPLDELHLVREHRPLLQLRLRWVMSAAGFWLWFNIAIKALGLHDPVYKILYAIWTVPILGTFGPSLGDLIEFGFTVFMSFAVSRFVRFVLREDVYPRVRLARGVPYAITTLMHYSVLLIGLWIAFTALDVDRTKFTILASAFGVGIGFGLQTVVNNFVSGLLLLFERPIQVGDIVELDAGQMGTVSNIGIRASIIRTMDAAEIIVPNSLLIANRVTNWTFSTRQRGFTMDITIVPGPDPDIVINAMLDAAANTRLVLQSPRPQAYLVEFTAGTGIKFELRVWTAQFEDWITARSDLGLNISKTFGAAGILIK